MNNVEEYFGLWLDAPCGVLFSVACKKKAKKVEIGCSNQEILNEAQKAIQMNDYIIQLLQRITTKLDELSQLKQTPKEKNTTSILEIKNKINSILNNSSLIRLSLHLNIFISLILITLIMFFIAILFKRRHLIKKPYLSIFSFKNLNYENKQTNSNEYEELLYNPNTSANLNRNLADKV